MSKRSFPFTIDGRWHYATAAYTAGGNFETAQIYLDGVPQTTTGDTGAMSSTSSYYGFGYWWGDGYSTINGLIDEGRISGVARSAGWIQTEYKNQSAPASFYAISAQMAPVTISTATLPNGTVGAVYPGANLAASGGTGSGYGWSASGLPAGLTLSAAGQLSGTPMAAGSSNVTLTVTDSGGNSASRILGLTVVTAPLTITTTTLAGGTVGGAYSQTLSASGGTLPYSWAISSGSLPGGLTLSGNTIGGSPTGAGTFSFMAKVTDNVGAMASQSLSIVVGTRPPAPVVTTLLLPAGPVGSAYSQTLAASGGTPPYANWKLAAGSLPPGLTLSSSGLISGTPSSVGSATVTVEVTDSGIPAQSGTAQYTMTVAGDCNLREFVRMAGKVVAIENSQAGCVPASGLALVSTPGFGKVLYIGTATPPANWYAPGFNDSSWPATVSGDSANLPPVAGAPQISDSTRQPWGTFDLFRLYFTLPAETIASATMQMSIDNNGIGVYVNGTPVSIASVPTVNSGGYLFQYGSISIPGSLFVPGQNVVAVEIQDNTFEDLITSPMALAFYMTFVSGGSH